MADNYLDQKLVGTACVRVALAMIDYSNAGPNDMPEVAEYLSKAMDIMSDKLTPTNQDNFADWLIKKADEAREKIAL